MSCKESGCPLQANSDLSQCNKCNKYRPSWLQGIKKAGENAAKGLRETFTPSRHRRQRITDGSWADNELKRQEKDPED